KPQVIIKEIDGKQCEPIEEVQIDIPDEFTGTIMESIGERKGEMLDMVNDGNGQVRLTFHVPSRGLLGYATEFMSQTRRYGIINHTFSHYDPLVKDYVSGRREGALVALENGKTSAYGILHLEDRGTIFLEPGVEVYAGMIVGEHNRENDLTVNRSEEHTSELQSRFD